MAKKNSIKLSANVEQFEKAIGSMSKDLKDLSSQSTNSFSKTSKIINDFSKSTESAKDKVTKMSSTEKALNNALEKSKKVLTEHTNKLNKQAKTYEKLAAKAKLAGISIRDAFLIGGVTKGIDLLVQGFSKLTSGAVESVKSFESVSASLSAWTGNIDTAKAKFWELNALEDETLISTDKLAQSYVKLGNFNLNNSTESIKNLAKVATGLNVDLNTVVDSLDKASQGQFKSLKQLGITAEQVGDKINLTYQGQTQTIKANTAELQSYFDSLANNKFDSVLEAKTQTLTGALGRVGNAWGSLQTVILSADSPIGQFLTKLSNNFADFINDLVAKFQNGQVKKQIENFINTVLKSSNAFINSISQAFTTFYNWFNESTTQTTKDLSLTWGSWFEWISHKLVAMQTHVIGVLATVGTQLKNMGSSFANTATAAIAMDPKAMAEGVKRAQKEIADNEKELVEYLALQDKARQEAEDAINKANVKYKENLKLQSEEIQLLNLKAEKVQGMAIGGGSTPKASVAKATDNLLAQMQQKWQAFYENVRQLGLSDLEKENERYNNQLALLDSYHEQGLAKEQEYKLALENLENEHVTNLNRIQSQINANKKDSKSSNALGMNVDDFNSITSSLTTMGDAFGDLTTNMSESSGAYKAMFAIQKSFSVASATLNCIQAWAQALSDPTAVTWPQKLANYASAIALTTQVMSQLGSISMFDKGGYIPSGQVGIVGEYGPELISGPTNVTSRKDTADLLSKSGNSNTNIVVNLIESADNQGTVESREDKEQTIINVFVADIRKGGQMASTLQNTFNLNRVGA